MNNFINKHLNLIVTILGIINLVIVLIFEIPCPWKTNFNIECAGCGSTRMFKSLFKLDIYQAFRYNPLMFCLLIIIICYLVYIAICKIKGRNYYKIQNRELWTLLIVVVLFTILRNIPIFSFLKPTVIK